MARLQWNQPGERYYEVGLDRGVLYTANPLGTFIGVAWSGLRTVAEAPTGAEPRPYYLDGYKYLNLSSSEEFEATIDAFGAPEEFYRCDGIDPIQNGLYVTQQPRIPFGLCYRTRIGNDVSDTEHGYKLHIVYNALAAPAQKTYETISDSIEPMLLSWHITTLAPKLMGWKPTAHLIVDSRKTPTQTLNTLEDILYGTDEHLPKLPDVGDIVSIFSS